MSTLKGKIYSRCSIAPIYPTKSHFQRTLSRERRARVRKNVAAHQEKDKKTGKRKAGEERRREINFKELCAALLQSLRGQHGEKMVCVGRSAWGNWNPRKGQQSFRPNPNGVGDCTTTLRRLLIGAVQFFSLSILYIRQKFRTSLFRKIRVNTCFGDGQKVRIND